MINLYLFKNDLFDGIDINLSDDILAHSSIHKSNEETYKSSIASYKLLSFLGYQVCFENELPKIDNMYLSISHSLNYVCVVLDNTPIGVDIEKIRDFNHELIKKVFSNEEDQNRPIDGLNEYFFSIWTKKEAYTKRLKTGLTSFPKDIEVQGWILTKIIDDIIVSISKEESSSLCINYGEDILKENKVFKSKKLHEETISTSDSMMLKEHEDDGEKRFSDRSENFVPERSNSSNAFKKRYFSDFED